MKQETLEEASLLSRPIHLIWDEGERYDCNEKFREEFKKGAKWQQEQILDFLYSEITERRDYSASKMCEKVVEFIEQFKNKTL